MTGVQRVAIAVAVVAAGSLAGCTNDEASPEPSAPESTARSPETKPSLSTVTSTTSTSTTIASTTESSGSGTSSQQSSSQQTSSQQTVVRTNGGSIEVRGDGNVLEVVDISTADGWEVQVDRPDDRQLVAVFTGPTGRSEVTIVLTDQGIQTSTQSTS
jgi:hypothetical protein